MILDRNLPSFLEARRALDSNGGDQRQKAVGSIPRNGRSFAEVADRIEEKKSTEPGAAEPSKPFDGQRAALWQNGDFSFADFLDIINPLQHIPIVATIYRHMSGDALGMAPRVIGGALWGRLGGLVAGLVNAVVEWFTGKDIGDHVYAYFFGEPKSSLPNGALAASKDAPPSMAHDRRNPRAYPASLSRAPRENGLRSDADPDRRVIFSNLPVHIGAPAAWSNKVLVSHYFSSAPMKRAPDRPSALRLSA